MWRLGRRGFATCMRRPIPPTCSTWRRGLCTGEGKGRTIEIDVSALPQRGAPPPPPPPPPGTGRGLVDIMATQMRVRGPMSIKEFMTVALTHPTHGYYMQHDEVFGRAGDFVTSPEVSPLFGDLVGVWCVACWEALGRPARLRVLEAGPGRGTLMADILRSTVAFPPFQDALAIEMIEVSPHLRRVQRETLVTAAAAAGAPGSADPPSATNRSIAMDDGAAQTLPSASTTPSAAAAAAAAPPPLLWRAAGASEECGGVEVRWHAALEEVPTRPDVPELTIAHEFFDALPVHQLVSTPRGWRERMVDLTEHSQTAREAGAPPTVTNGGASGGVGGGVVDASGGVEGSVGVTSGGTGSGGVWRDLDTDARAFDFVLSANPTPASILFGERFGERLGGSSDGGSDGGSGGAGDGAGASSDASSGDGDGGAEEGGGVAKVLGALEFSPAAISFMQQLSRRLAACRGAALIVDYGHDGVPTDTLRGIASHRAVHPLHAPGQVRPPRLSCPIRACTLPLPPRAPAVRVPCHHAPSRTCTLSQRPQPYVYPLPLHVPPPYPHGCVPCLRVPGVPPGRWISPLTWTSGPCDG